MREEQIEVDALQVRRLSSIRGMPARSQPRAETKACPMPWWIDKPLILGSGNPTGQQLEELDQHGFRSVISLLDEKEQPPNYDPHAIEARGFTRYSIPLKDFSAPTLEQFQRFFELTSQALKHGKVLVHCEGGTGRTGTMAAAYWIYRGMSAEEAIRKIRQSNSSAIETDAQMRSVYTLAASKR
jgi:protein-tyrosine phosphatase